MDDASLSFSYSSFCYILHMQLYPVVLSACSSSLYPPGLIKPLPVCLLVDISDLLVMVRKDQHSQYVAALPLC